VKHLYLDDRGVESMNSMANNMTYRTYDEKRDFIRMKIDTEITLSLDKNNKHVKGICRDLSGTGMLIEVAEEVSEGSTCKTTLPSNNEAFPALDASITIIRCTEIEEGKYQLGTEILEIAH
jgi:hypothetical protein